MAENGISVAIGGVAVRICVIGDTGLLGQALVRGLSTGNELFGVSAPSPRTAATIPDHDRAEIDLLEKAAHFFDIMDSFKPELMINAAACVDIQKCEREPDYALRINGTLPGQLAQYAARKSASFIHVSTDAVFDGARKISYCEDDLPNPKNQYGKSKLAGEQEVLRHHPGALICRTNIVGFRGWSGMPTFAEWLCDALYYKKPITLADDFITSSLHVEDLVSLSFKIIQKQGHGLFHVATRDAASKYQFGEVLAVELGVPLLHVTQGSLKDLNLHPPRAGFIALNVQKAESFLGRKLPDTKNTAQKLARDYKQQIGKRHHERSEEKAA